MTELVMRAKVGVCDDEMARVVADVAGSERRVWRSRSEKGGMVIGIGVRRRKDKEGRRWCWHARCRGSRRSSRRRRYTARRNMRAKTRGMMNLSTYDDRR